MKLPSLSRLPNNKRFNFEPRFYDPAKEELEQRKAMIERAFEDKNHGDAIKYRISQSFSSSRNSGTVKVNLLQLFMILIVAFAIIGFLYIGIIAFLLSAAAIVLCILVKKGVFDFLTDSKINIVPDPYGTRERISGQIKESAYFNRSKAKPQRGLYKLGMLAIMTGVAIAYYVEQLNGIVALLFIFVLLILFIKESRKA